MRARQFLVLPSSDTKWNTCHTDCEKIRVPKVYVILMNAFSGLGWPICCDAAHIERSKCLTCRNAMPRLRTRLWSLIASTKPTC